MSCAETSRDLLCYLEEDIKINWYDLHANRRARDLPRDNDPIRLSIRHNYVLEIANNIENLRRCFRIRRRELGR